jgi:death-on-curing family protein
MKIDRDQIIDWNKTLVLMSKEPHGLVKQGIEAALHRTEYYDTPTEKAAALFHSLINNHHFLQANKRTSIVALLASLSEFDFSIDFLYDLVMDTVHDHLDVEAIADRLKAEMELRKEEITSVDEIFRKYEILIERLINV